MALLLAAEGTAEYWILSTGQRAQISLAEIDYEHIKATIDAAIAGMLAGEFEVGDQCWGLCQTFARD
jgi:hypothetical protein